MQVKKVCSEEKHEKRRDLSIVKYCIGGTIWIVIVTFISFLMYGIYLTSEQGRWKVIGVGVLLVIIVGIGMTSMFLGIADIRDAKKRCHFYKIAIVITAIAMILIPLILQGVYQATKENIIITEDTQTISERIIYLIDKNEVEQQIVTSENDIITVQFEENIEPYVEVVQYCTMLTTDNQNPWGRTTIETIKEWKQYEFHLNALGKKQIE